MAGSDAIVVVEEWISEHYFTTDATSQSFQGRALARRKAWDNDRATDTPLTRFREVRRSLLDRLSDLIPPDEIGDVFIDRATLGDLYARLRTILGYDGPGLRAERRGPVLQISAPGLAEGHPLVLVEGVATGSVEELLTKDADTLLEPFELEESTTLTSAARTLSALFVADDAPEFALLFGGRFAIVAERARWAEGRYLAIDLQVICERNDTRRAGEVDRALTCLAAESLAPDAEGNIWWTETLDDSIQHTVGVSKDLREGVRLSIEILANEVVRRRAVQGLPALPDDQAQPLALQSLRFLYRILFLLYAEASLELEILPVGSPEYERGYSLDRLRDLTLAELASEHTRQGTHLYQSLGVLFRLVDRDPTATAGAPPEGLEFRSLRSDLFRPEATELVDAVGLGNAALQQVLQHLLLSKESPGKDRGFISYAELGINQLGAAYEGLMSYTGFFATEDLYEVAKDGDPSKGSWVVPVDRADGLDKKDFVVRHHPITGEPQPVIHERGTFVFRLAGQERQQSASYYTPEVLTRFVVSQALEELLDQDGRTTPAAEILTMTVCEPALGSGAFAIEAVRQLAEQYLRRRQDELGQRIDPDEYPRRLQEVKAYLALHQVYGVDLNATAVELAEISLWLDTMVAGLDAPWFGLHLRRGNSLIGARRAVYRRDQVARKTWLADTPEYISLSSDEDPGGQVHHFLLPAEGWGSAADAKEGKALAPEAVERLKAWRKTIQSKPMAAQVAALVDLGRRVETLWGFALRRLQIAEHEIRRRIPVWGLDQSGQPGISSVQREEIETALADANGAYGRLRRVMDAWCALWFWPLTDELTTQRLDGRTDRIAPPTLDDWIEALQMLLGLHAEKQRRDPGQANLAAGVAWTELDLEESLNLDFAAALPVDDVLAEHPWLQVCQEVANRQGFFHWELDFAPIFASGGFELQLGNPPWVRPDSDMDALLAEGDPWWQLAVKPTETQRRAKRAETLGLPGVQAQVVDGLQDITCVASFLGSPQQYPALIGLHPDLYRCFMVQTWKHQSSNGVIGLIHPEGHFADDKGGTLRSTVYLRLRSHWQFINELKLFDIGNLRTYGVHIYSVPRERPFFRQATSLYHPDTVTRSLTHDGSGLAPGFKNSDGQWDTRPHRSRVIFVSEETIRNWHEIVHDDESIPILHSRMVYVINRSTGNTLGKISKASRIAALGLDFSTGWQEKEDRTKGYFVSEWGRVTSWDDAILQGPHLYVATPLYKTPNRTMLNHRDWSATDFESMAPQALPVTAYKPLGNRYRYDCGYTEWGDENCPRPARDYYRIAWRRRAANTGERTLIPALIPPGAAHVHTVYSAGSPEIPMKQIAQVGAFAASLIADFSVRTMAKNDIQEETFSRLPYIDVHALMPELAIRYARLVCITEAYADFWVQVFSPPFIRAEWTNPDRPWRPLPLGEVERTWQPGTLLRRAVDRRQALVELDALVALMLGLSAEELCTIYRTQFPVLYGYDHNDHFYDTNGRLVPNSVLTAWRKKGGRLNVEERTATNHAGNTYTYELPFITLDREEDMRRAYAVFEAQSEATR